MHKPELGKYLLVSLMAISLLPIIPILDFKLLQSGETRLLFWNKLFGTTGAIMLWWQIMLGVRGLVKLFTPDLVWAMNIHKQLGKYFTLLLFIHPFGYLFYYYIMLKLHILDFQNPDIFSFAVYLGLIALILLLIIYLTSAIWRSRLSFRMWKFIHLLAYAITPLVLIHALILSQGTYTFYYWALLMSLFVVICIYRVLFNLGFFRKRYQVIEYITEADNIFSLTLKPLDPNPLMPQWGQFIFFHYPLVPGSHPFSVSNFDPDQKLITLSIKDLGPFTHMLETIQVGDKVLLDGPYGVFTQEVKTTDKDIVFLAGGIGITPFLGHIRQSHLLKKKKLTLFYANRSEKDVAFQVEFNELDKTLANLTIVNLLENPGEMEMCNLEKGYICRETLEKYLTRNYTDYEYFICGPKPMLKAMKQMLKEMRVPKQQVHFEDFAY